MPAFGQFDEKSLAEAIVSRRQKERALGGSLTFFFFCQSEHNQVKWALGQPIRVDLNRSRYSAGLVLKRR